MKIVKPLFQVLFVLMLLLSEASAFIPQQVEADPTPVVEGNTVRISGTDAYIEATPATLIASGWVEVTFWTRYYDGAVDVVYGFNGLDNVKAMNPQVWESYVHNKTRQIPAVLTADFKPDKVISTNTAAIRPAKADTDLSLNSQYTEITYEANSPMSGKTTQQTMKLAYDSYDSKTGAYSYKYNGTVAENYTETYVDWNAKSQPTSDSLPYAGANKWNTTQYKPVVKNEVQKTRVWIDIPFAGTNAVSGKYDIGIKPSSLTLQQAKDQGKLWLLDPWYNASWSYRDTITVTNKADSYQTRVTVHYGAGANAANVVYCNSHCKTDFSDIRFTDTDGTTLLDYWVESTYTSDNTTVWVESAATSAATQFMYYGNAGASAVGLDLAAGKATFLFFDDFNNGTTLDAQWNQTAGSPTVASGNLLLHATSVDQIRASGYSAPTTVKVRSRMKNSVTNGVLTAVGLSNSVLASGFGADDAMRFSPQNDGNFYVQVFNGGVSSYGGSAYSADTFYIMQCNLISATSAVFTKDDAAYYTATTNVPDAACNPRMEASGGGGTASIDWFFVAKFTANEPSYAFGAESGYPTCALSGTVTTATDPDIRTGGKTIILTMTNDTWVASGATFDAQRANIIAGLTSAGAEAHGWNNEVKAKIAVTDVVRTNDTVCTITLDAEAGYAITANETITVTVPATVLTVGSAIIASPTFTITYAATATITLSAASSVTDTTATLNGNITDVGAGSPTITCYWGTTDHPGTSIGWDNNGVATYGGGVAAFTKAVTSLSTGTTYYFTAKAVNGAGTSWPAASLSLLTKPAAPTNVAATDGSNTTKVVVTWTKSTGATAYKVYEGVNLLNTLGDVATYDDSAAPAPTITPGTATATDGTSTTQVTLTVSGQSAANGASRTYKVTAGNATGYSGDSATDTGYRGTTTLTYAWQVSAGVPDNTFGAIGGGTTNPYNYTSAPAPSITPGTATASDATSSSCSTLTVAGQSVANGASRYYYCIVSMTGATNQDTTHNDGYRGTTTLTYAWQRSAGDADNTFGAIGGGTTNPYNDVAAVVTPDGRYYYCIISMTGASDANTTHDRGNRSVFAAPTVVTGICSGSGTTWAGLNGMVTAQGDAAVSQYGFEYGLTTGYGTDSLTSANTANNVNYFKNQSTLTPSTIYHYRAKAFNTAWGYGADAIFATKGSPAITTYFNTGDDTQTDIYGVNVAAQTFTTSATTEYTVTSVRLKILRVLSPGTITVSIRHATAGAGNEPTGVNLASGTINGNTIDTSAAWCDIPMTTETTLELNSTYAIVVSAASGDSSNYVRWRRVAAGGLANGNGDTSANSGITWSAQTYDFMFELWGNQALAIQDAKVFQSYKATGDWLVVVRYVDTYAPYYDTYDVKKYFTLQLVDSLGTVKASTVMPAWGNRVGSIYLSATAVSPLTYGGDYRVRIQGTFTGTPYTEYALVGADWLGADLTNLDSWILTSSTVIGTYYATSMTSYIAERGEVLNSTGAGVFNNGISGLAQVRPAIFQTYTVPSTYTPGVITQSGRTAIPAWQTNVGPDATIMLTRVGNIVGIGGDIIAVIAFLIMMFILMALAFPAGNTTAAMVLSLPMLGAAIWFGMDLLYIGMLALVAAFLFIKNFWIDKGN